MATERLIPANGEEVPRTDTDYVRTTVERGRFPGTGGGFIPSGPPEFTWQRVVTVLEPFELARGSVILGTSGDSDAPRLFWKAWDSEGEWRASRPWICQAGTEHTDEDVYVIEIRWSADS